MSLLIAILLSVTNPLIGWGIDTYGARLVIGSLSLVSLGIALPLAFAIQRRDKKN